MIVERCYCCYKKDLKDLQYFNTSNKEDYKEITGFDIADQEVMICNNCLISLKNALEFIKLCKQSREKFHQEEIDISEISEEHIIFDESNDNYEEEEEEAENPEAAKKYSCNICEMKFRQRNALKCHERVHTKVLFINFI